MKVLWFYTFLGFFFSQSHECSPNSVVTDTITMVWDPDIFPVCYAWWTYYSKVMLEMWLKINWLLFDYFAILTITKNYPGMYIYCDACNQGLGEKLWRISIVLGGLAYYAVSLFL